MNENITVFQGDTCIFIVDELFVIRFDQEHADQVNLDP